MIDQAKKRMETAKRNGHLNGKAASKRINPMSLSVGETIRQDFDVFLQQYKEKLKTLFTKRNDEDQLASERGLPPYVFQQIQSCAPLAAFIPKAYGGRGGQTAEALSMLEVSSYQSLPLSLMMGINGALFLQPLANYGEESVKRTVFDGVISRGKMGGLMITEPDFGSDALRMKTGYRHTESGYRVAGTKHWAGLTGWADYWLITARPLDAQGELGRDVSFFVHDSERGGIDVEEVFQNLGLYMLPYGRNRIDIEVPESDKLAPRSTGIKMMLDILHRSRLQFPGMSTGFLRRMLDEAMAHCKTRFVGGASLLNYDQVKSRIASLQSHFTASSAMAYFTSRNVPLTQDTSRMDLAANSIKSVSTDYMQSASQHLLQLVGAKGYRLDHIAGRAMVDSRPFQIFEGSNDILYQQISESVLKLMKNMSEKNLFRFANQHPLMSMASERFRDLLDFDVDVKMAQRKLVELGRALGRLITMNMTMELGIKGFDAQLIQNSLEVVEQEIRGIFASYRFQPSVQGSVMENTPDDASWRQFMPA